MLVLASASPRRLELLRNAGIDFTVQRTDILEIPQPGEVPRAFAERLAREKALDVFRVRPSDHILGADTIVVVDSHILGKPRDAADAARMLRLLSNRSHYVTTGVCLVRPGNDVSHKYPEAALKPTPDNRVAKTNFDQLTVDCETTLVTMGPIDDDEISAYVATGEPMDKAGAYAIQGIASRWISRIEGDYFNVVGLPVSLICRMLKEDGVHIPIAPPPNATARFT